ncbi:Hydroxylamine oxidoreductase (Fragment) [hydrothermal vent metagenome]|uniref:Hydroxylamine oxidoreductase n=2 Tax=hydrothermal vent metagenome TaxID=652676 RepID=A0A1W1DYT7_9ZZZZ|nr:hydroxylamine oxidoreductase [Gammaproteobacteria bacterium]
MKGIVRSLIVLLSLTFLSSLALASVSKPPEKMSETSKQCTTCHKKNNNGIVQQWGDSKHHRAKVGCYECHAAEATDSDAFLHGKKGNEKYISIIVSPRDCANCHAQEVKEAEESHHAKAARILSSLDNLLAEVVEGNSNFFTEAFPEGNSAVAVNGCWQCHGSQVKVLKDGSLDPATWPNTGIGRINPDGSEGSCTACHARHSFSVEQARAPETCGKCHMGPDHPHIEIYNESKHGIQYASQKGQLGMDKSKWIPGEDYFTAPTCSTCHMGATKDQDVTHNVGLRISWNNRPPVSIRPEVSDKKMGLVSQNIDWETRRDNMQNVCASCHSGDYIDNFYIQYDGLIELYNEKFAKPGIALMKAAKPLMKPVKFSNKIDFIWFELWHHEGRRARHGASMMGPDITHWHGTYEIAKNFYTHLIPELEHLIEKGEASYDEGKQAAAKHLQATLDRILNTDNHKWYLGKMSAKQQEIRRQATESFKAQFKSK